MAELKKVFIPDIGDFKDVPVIEVLVKNGDNVQVEDSLVTLESDKATIEVPSPYSGQVREIFVKAGDKVSEGTVILAIETATAQPAQQSDQVSPALAADQSAVDEKKAAVPQPATSVRQSIPSVTSDVVLPVSTKAHASPSIRRFARELGVDLGAVNGSGPKGRITQSDVQAFVKAALGRMKGVLFAQVPFAEHAGGVTGLLHGLSDGDFIQRELLGVFHRTQWA